jgi:DNA invertase Pin-like site-specific DNA recombinase
MSFGVPLGAKSPAQPEKESAGNPISARPPVDCDQIGARQTFVRVMALRGQGLSIRQIAERTGVSKSAVERRLKEGA